MRAPGEVDDKIMTHETRRDDFRPDNNTHAVTDTPADSYPLATPPHRHYLTHSLTPVTPLTRRLYYV